MSIKIVSYNINGLRSSLEKGLLDWVEDEGFDIVCLQETKTSEAKVPQLLIRAAGFQHVWHHALRAGYSGTATLSLQPPTNVIYGLGVEEFDNEGRVLQTEFEQFTLLNCYFPNGGSGDVRLKFKMRFLEAFYQRTQELLGSGRPLIVVGDYNIAHQEIDLHDPGGNRGTSGFLAAERDWLSRWLELGMVDSFRYKFPREIGYTWWFHRGTKAQNRGWRIDYLSVSANLADRIVNVSHRQEVNFSDHCPVVLELDF